MGVVESQRTLVKSVPELWAQLSEVALLRPMLGPFGEIAITRLVPEASIEWRSELMEGFSITPSANRKTLDVVQKAPTYLSYINESANAYIRHTPRIEVGSSLDRQQYFGNFAERIRGL